MRLGDRHIQEVSSKECADCVQSWKRGQAYSLNTRGLKRLHIEIEDADVLDLFYALIGRHQRSASVSETVELCAEAMSRLASCLRTAQKPGVRHSSDLDIPVQTLRRSFRIRDRLKSASIQNIRELVQLTEGDLLRHQNFGRGSLDELKETLSSMGLSLGMKIDSRGNPVKSDSV
jgi:hypothetical protein